jgi:2-polyprenyl-3-methyl-5-hydroxy-6-metoxy-1,4-benzoquinol methylase
MNQEFLTILENPITHEEFEYNEKLNVLKSIKSDVVYSVHDDVVIILEPNKNDILPSDELHRKYKTPFNYQEHYQKDAEHFDYFNENESIVSKHESRRLHENIFKRIDDSFSLILDVGCGKGWVAQKALPKGIKVISMDISTTNPQKVTKLYAHRNHLGLVADVFNIPIKDHSLDCIIASEIMEHVADPKKFVEILYSKLKLNGKLIISTPYNEQLEYFLCVHCNRATPRYAHLHSFNEKNIGKLIPVNSQWTWQKLNNNYLVKLRSDLILNIFPYAIWRFFDKIANSIYSKPLRLIIEIKKNHT